MFLYIQFIINLDFFEQTYLFEEKLHLKCALSNQTILNQKILDEIKFLNNFIQIVILNQNVSFNRKSIRTFVSIIKSIQTKQFIEIIISCSYLKKIQ